MRVAMYYNNHDIRIEEMPVPEIDEGELLIRVEACGICGSDVMEWYRVRKAPLVLGHEIAGEIVGVGSGTRGYLEGMRVSASHHVPCNTCRYCMRGHHTVCETLRTTNFYPGGFSEYLRLPPINVDRGVYPIPDELSYGEATFTEPLACVLRGLRRSGMKPGDSVLVIGSGISGLLYIKLAAALGAAKIFAVDISEERLDAARRFGAHHTFGAGEIQKEVIYDNNDGYLADIVILCTGARSAVEAALTLVERGGTLLVFAPTDEGVKIPFDLNEVFWRTDVTITTSYAGTPADHVTALELMRTRRVVVSDMITHRFPLAETVKGFSLVQEGGRSIKVIIEPQK
ncbi:MAG: alcohol dehydrogenase catalytic domain-containing protein [Candidatus Glassbacteria bacterium]